MSYKINQSKCNGCGDCMPVCPIDAINVQNGVYTIDYLKCIGCEACVAVCPKDAIEEVEE